MKLKLLEQIQGTITHVDTKGRGVMTYNDKNIVIPFTVPADEVKITLISRKHGELHGRINEIISPSTDRLRPECPYVGSCGGCPWQMINYKKQLELKFELVNKHFVQQNLDIKLDSVELAKEIFYHRNRMDYVFGKNGELGLKEPEQWWSVLNLETCFLLSEDANKVMQLVRDWSKKWKLEFWNNKTYTGFLRYLVIREGKNTNERLINLVTASGELKKEASLDLIEKLKNLCTTIYWGINPLTTDISVADELHLLYGKPFLTEQINGFSFDIHPNSFFQTNSAMAGRLMEMVGEFAELEKTDRLLDLYCGLGFFGIGLAKQVKEVIGVELDAEAIKLAEVNAKTNNIVNAAFLAGPTEEILPKLPKPDVVIVDPPRGGLHPKALETLLVVLPRRIVYVSCNYQSLAKELPKLLEFYKISKIRGLDLFPHSPHVEVITALERKK